MTKYMVVIERADGNFSAYVPDLPGCIVAGKTIEEVRSLMRKAIQMHIEGLREDGEPVPAASSSAEYLDT